MQTQFLKEQCHILRIRAGMLLRIAKLESVGPTLSSLESKMASSLEGTHGWKRDNYGRKRKDQDNESRRKSWGSQRKRIYLVNNIFEPWRNAKIEAGYSHCSNSEFAAHLLSLEYRQR